jgi:hypothetical protein
MPCEHMPFIPQLDGFNDYRRGRSRHRALTRAPLAFVGRGDAGHHVGPKTSADPCGFRGGISAGHCHQRYASPSDPRITYRRELPWEDSAMASDLTELGQEVIAAVSRGVADGAPLVKCQLLASAFYEALRHELRKADASKRITLLAVTDRCHRSAAANISPVQALHELKRAIDLLQPGILGGSEAIPRSRPVLRVIQGGLSSR